MKKYLVFIDEGNGWEECGEGRLTQKQAERIAREIREDCPGVKAEARRAGADLKTYTIKSARAQVLARADELEAAIKKAETRDRA